MIIDEKLIEDLAAQEFEARMVVEGMDMMNVAGLSYEDRKKQAIEYAKARAKLQRAQQMLNEAMRGQIGRLQDS